MLVHYHNILDYVVHFALNILTNGDRVTVVARRSRSSFGENWVNNATTNQSFAPDVPETERNACTFPLLPKNPA